MLPFLATTLFQTLVLATVSFYLFRQQRQPYLGWWAAAWLLGVPRHGIPLVAMLAGAGDATLPELLFVLLQAGAVLAGALALAGRPLPRVVPILATVGLGWIVAGPLLHLSFLAWTVVPLTLLGLATLTAGVVVARTQAPGVGRWMASTALVLWGLHQLDYPFLRPIPEAAQWGYPIGSALETLTAMGFLVLAHERALQAARRAVREHEDFIAKLPVGAFETTGDGRFRKANAALAESLGYSLEELLELDIATDLYLDPAERERLQTTYSGDLLPPTEVTWKHADGSPRRLVLHGRRVHDADGRFSHFEGIARDVTEQRRAEAIAARSSRMEALGRLAGSIAHDFNNLLVVIRGGIDMLRLGDGQQTQRWLDEMDAAAERAATLTQNLLTIARGGRAERQPVDVGGALDRLRPMLDRLAGDATVELRSDADGPCVRAEPGSVDQIVLNLVTNAGEAGASRVNVDCAEVELGAREAATLGIAPGPYVRLQVRDDGAGMDTATVQRIFEPFFTTRREGTGLGLATVYAAVDRIDGCIDVESEPGRGTTFSVYLPRSERGPSTVPVSAKRPSFGGGKVLVLDDEDAVRQAVATMFARLGFDVRTAHDRASALEVARTEPDIALVFSDVNLGPDDTGPKVAEALAELLPQARVFFMSGYPPSDMDDEMLARLLTKPFTQAELRAWLIEQGMTPCVSTGPPSAP